MREQDLPRKNWILLRQNFNIRKAITTIISMSLKIIYLDKMNSVGIMGKTMMVACKVLECLFLIIIKDMKESGEMDK